MKAPLILRVLLVLILINRILIILNIKMSFIPFIFIIVIIRGVIVIFRYLASFVLNEWSIKVNYYILFFLLIFLSYIIYININAYLNFEFMRNLKVNSRLYYLYINYFGFISIFLISYLFLVLLVVLKISSEFRIHLRLKKYRKNWLLLTFF